MNFMTKRGENEMRFVDTNILLYAVLAIAEDKEKRDRALDLLNKDDLVISVQVLQEFYYQSTQPKRQGAVTHQQALGFLESLSHIPAESMTMEIFLSATAISNRYQLSYWDGAILAAAQSAGCDAVYSEDMSPTQDYGGIRVINPFINN